MTDERLFKRLAAHAGPADVDSGFEDRLYVLLQQEMGRSRRSARPMLLLVAALLAILAISAAVAVGSGMVEVPWLEESPAPSAVESSPTPAVAEGPAWVSRMPTRAGSGGPAGVYGTVAVPNGRSWSAGMHNVVELGSDFRQTQITFAAADDCFAGAEGPKPVPVTIAGLDGMYVEPYDDPSVQFSRPRDGVTTGAYGLPVGDRTLCVYLSWDADTTAEELDAARRVVESIRVRPFGPNGIQVNFTLPAGWDTG